MIGGGEGAHKRLEEGRVSGARDTASLTDGPGSATRQNLSSDLILRQGVTIFRQRSTNPCHKKKGEEEEEGEEREREKMKKREEKLRKKESIFKPKKEALVKKDLKQKTSFGAKAT